MKIKELSKKALSATAALIAIVVCLAASAAGQQGTTTLFTYDENGRLKSVILPTGETAVYNYDAAGNITSIQRIAQNGLALQDFSPKEGTVSDQVTFTGVGFGATIAQNTVKFYNNITANIVFASPTLLIAEVPQGATTGTVSVTTPLGTVTTATPFSVVAKLRVQPSDVDVEPTASRQFTAIFTSFSGDQSVTWKVNDITGGNSTVGAITAGGLYTAPALADTQESLSVTVKAVSVAQPTLTSEAAVTVKRKLLGVSSAAVSVRKGGVLGPAAAPSVMVRYGAAPPNAPAITSVSVRYGAAPPNAPAITSVSVRYGAAPPNAPAQAGVSVTSGPVISSLTPTAIARNSTVTLTINGSNLTGATALRFLTSTRAVDSQITVSNISVNAEGTTLTAQATVSSSAALGSRIVVVVAASKSLDANLGINTVTIQ